MLSIINRAIGRRRAVRQEALRLIYGQGLEGWHVARDHASDMQLPEDERAFWAGVKMAIEDKLEIDWPPDTANRYLEV